MSAPASEAAGKTRRGIIVLLPLIVFIGLAVLRKCSLRARRRTAASRRARGESEFFTAKVIFSRVVMA